MSIEAIWTAGFQTGPANPPLYLAVPLMPAYLPVPSTYSKTPSILAPSLASACQMNVARSPS